MSGQGGMWVPKPGGGTTYVIATGVRK
ncbi:unnamed protein product [uncultured virus]|nr:unnamed protein product [uncultured virus]